jgi:hypothetical protein
LAWHKTWVARDIHWRGILLSIARVFREQIDYMSVVKKENYAEKRKKKQAIYAITAPCFYEGLLRDNITFVQKYRT